jgi:hypothetical protein
MLCLGLKRVGTTESEREGQAASPPAWFAHAGGRGVEYRQLRLKRVHAKEGALAYYLW